MDTILNIKAFLLVAETSSLTAAARQLGVVPSVITKRINRLEDQMRVQLLHRTTRRITLTPEGEMRLPRLRAAVGQIDSIFQDSAASSAEVEGHLRIKSPTTIAIRSLGEMLPRFQLLHPKISVELVMLDRSVNPVEEGFDIAIGALPTSYPGVIDEPLCAYPRVLCAAPAYLARYGEPSHPRDLVQHDCLTFATTGLSWGFESRRGLINVEIKARLSANDSQLLLRAALAGMGIARLAKNVAEPALSSGLLVPVLADYPVPEFWIKALVPRNRQDRPAVRSFVDALKAHFGQSLGRPHD
ncbi:transcriptional regulator [Bradyrhizobium guangdongense]|uniref:LysR family transcriptional regulator n=1 Tax=Bradyrhizobium guangdongense TaxID=1325090 RepID=UPI00112BFEEE|nr:LysR family transcriptional regulator [Bradyrhizobium guangdongense]TPQ34446.1 transcriptional regulator [Bradyrhizobium guangdongense]